VIERRKLGAGAHIEQKPAVLDVVARHAKARVEAPIHVNGVRSEAARAAERRTQKK